MAWNVSPPTPLEYFARLVESDDEFPLLESAIALAQHAEPALDIQQVLAEVDALAARLHRAVDVDASPLVRLGSLNRWFFQEQDFALNRNDYHAPQNSFVHRVLLTRRGIPISLAVIWLELAQTLGLHALGVGFPGHFLVSVRLPQGLAVIDPATGESLSREQLTSYLEGLAPTDEAGHVLRLNVDAFLRPSTPREIIERMLRNLREIYVMRNDRERLLGVLDRLIVLRPEASSLRRERGQLHDAMGHAAEALADLDWCVRHGDNDAALAERVAQLRWMLS